MGKKILKLTENQMRDVLDTIIKENQQLSEDNPGGSGPWYRAPGPGVEKTRTVSRPVTIPGSLFPTGKTDVIKNSNEYNQAKSAISDALKKTKDLTVKVVGGASRAGASLEFNTKLAQRRSENFVKALQSEFPNVKFTVGSPVVGNADVVGSPEALKQQNVTLYFTTVEETSYITQAVDNTAHRVPDIYGKKGKVRVTTSDPYIICFEIDGSLVGGAMKVVQGIKGVSNVTKKKKEKGFWDKWFG